MFEKAFDFVIEHEGGYVFDENDPGGETKYGISKKAHPQLDIKNLTKKQAKTIYKKYYWDRISGDKLPKKLALFLFDTAVNCGCKKAGIWLQMSLNMICQSGLLIDGKIGKKTLLAYSMCEKDIICNIASLRLKHYTSLGRIVYINGWVNRVSDLLKEIGIYD